MYDIHDSKGNELISAKIIGNYLAEKHDTVYSIKTNKDIPGHSDFAFKIKNQIVKIESKCLLDNDITPNAILTFTKNQVNSEKKIIAISWKDERFFTHIDIISVNMNNLMSKGILIEKGNNFIYRFNMSKHHYFSTRNVFVKIDSKGNVIAKEKYVLLASITKQSCIRLARKEK